MLLPRLFTLIQQERRSASGPVLLLDLGDTGSVESAVCRATYGRAPFLVLDGMGYDAALIGGPERVPIPLHALRQLVGQIVMPLVVWDRAVPLVKRGITVTVAAGHAPLMDGKPGGIQVDRSTDRLPISGDPGVTLGDVSQGTLARVDVSWPEWLPQTALLLSVTPDILPDPTIAALVEFVEGEALSYAKQHGEADTSSGPSEPA